MKKISSRPVRIVVAGVLCGATIYTLAPYATNHVSTSAVVNAPILSIKAPFDGVVAVASPAVSTYLRHGDVAVELISDRNSRAELQTLQAEAAVLDGEYDAIEIQIADLQDLTGLLEDLLDAHADVARRQNAARRRDQAAALEQAGIELRLAEKEQDRAERLHGAGSLADVTLDTLDARLGRAAQEVARRQSQLDAIDIETGALDRNVFPEASDGSEIRQRMHEISIRLTDLAAVKAGLGHRRAALKRRISSLQNELTSRDAFAPKVAAGSVVWEASAATGSVVAQGDEILRLLDCDHRLVEVAIAERHFEKIATGDLAMVQLKGSPHRIEARVEAVRGRGGRLDRRGLAVDPPEIDAGQLGVLLRLAPEAGTAPQAEGGFCDVGRTAEVRFRRDGVTDLHLPDLPARAVVSDFFRDTAQRMGRVYASLTAS